MLQLYSSCTKYQNYRILNKNRDIIYCNYNNIKYLYLISYYTFCSIAANNGNDLNVVRSIVGHSNVAMTEHYTHYDMTVKKNVIDSVASKALLINSDNQFKLESIISNLNDTNCGCPQKLDNLTWCKMPVKLT